MSNMNKKVFKVLGAWAFAMLFYLVPNLSYGQTFDVDAAGSSDPIDDIIVDEDDLTVVIENVAGFTAGDMFYVYYNDNNDINEITEDNILEFQPYPPALPATRTYVSTMPEIGTWDVFVGQWDGRFDHSTTLTNNDVSEVFGTNQNDFVFTFNTAGARKLITNPVNLDGEIAADIEVQVNFALDASMTDNGFEFQWSTNGTDWGDPVVDQNTGESVIFADGVNYANNVLLTGVFELPVGAMNANTQFRIRQQNTLPIGSGDQVFQIFSITVLRGAPLTLEHGEFVGQYEVIAEPVAPGAGPADIEIVSIIDEDFVNVWASNFGIDVDLGETITISANTDNITLADYEYFVEYDGVDYLIPDTDIVEDQINDEVTIEFTIPVQNALAIGNLRDIRVKVVDGTTIVAPSLAFNEDLVLDAQSVSGANVSGSDAEFVQAGARQIVSEEYDITSLDDLTLSFEIARLSGATPAAGNEVVFEYTTDGATWNIIETIELGGVNGVGTSGMNFVYDEDSTQIEDIVSATTQFRLRQLNDANGANINTWEISNFILNQVGLGGNVLVSSNSGDLIFNQVSFNIEFADLNLSPLFPGSVVEVNVSDLSVFTPTGTVFEFYLADGHGNPNASDVNILATVAAADFDGTIALEMPFVSGARSIVARANYGSDIDVTSTALNLTVQPISVELTDFSFDYTDSGTDYNVSGNEITVDFDINGSPIVAGDLSLTAVLEIEVQANNWFAIGSEVLTTAMIDAGNATVTGDLPVVGVDEGLRNIRLRLENSASDNNNYFRGVYFNSFGVLNGIGERSTIFANDLNELDAFLIPHLFIQNATVDQDVLLQIDNGGWETLATYAITDGFTGYLSQVFNLADTVALTDSYNGTKMFRVIYNQDGEAANDENVLYLNGLSPIRPFVVTNSLSNTTSIELVHPTLELSDLEGPNNFEYYFEEAITVQYETTNIDAAEDLWFALVMQQNNVGDADFVYHVLNDSLGLNNVDLNVTFPTEAELSDLDFNTANSYDVLVYTYKQDVYNSLVIADHSESFNAITDAVAIDGNNANTFNQSGDRYAVSPAFDLSDWVGDITISFDYSANNIFVVNAQTLPKLEYSIDGGLTYTELSVDASNSLPSSGSHYLTADLPTVSDDVRFRWSQEVATGQWTLGSVNLQAGDDNRFDGFEINKINMPQTINLIEDLTNPYAAFTDLNDYTFTLFDAAEPLDPTITVGDTIDFNWSYDPDVATTVWPDSTVFEFFIVDGNANDVDDYILFATVTDTGDFVGNFAELVTTNTYDIYVRASLVDNGEVVWAYPQDMVDETEFDYPLEWVSTELVINETTDPEVNQLTLVSPEANDNFAINELFDVTYTTLGNFPVDVEFAVVIREPSTGAYEVLTTGTDFGTDITFEDVQMIAAAWLDVNDVLTSAYEVGVVAYQGAELVLANVEIELDEDDMIVLLGEDDDLYFEEEGDRVALTRALDLSDLVDPVLEFEYQAWNITMSLNTLPRLEVSIDGGATFAPVEVDDALGAQGYLAANGYVSYSIEIDPAFVTAATHFRWSQAINGGEYEDEWELWDIKIVSGTSNVYVNKGNAIKDWATIQLDAPSVNNYDWSLVLDANDLEPTIFNGGEFDFEWELQENALAFPVGTDVTFFIEFGGEFHEIATINAEGVHTADIPFTVERDDYDVYAVDSYNGGEINAMADVVGNINIYNEVLRTVYVPANNNLFAGEQVTFEANLENTVNPDDYDDVWFNLVVSDGSDWWLLAAQEGIVNQFVANLPPFLEGEDIEFVIIPSLNSQLANVGEIIQAGANSIVIPGTHNIHGSTGQFGSYTTADLDLTNYVTMSFELDIEEELANLDVDQLINLEYTLDGGQTYTSIASYPDVRFNDPSFFNGDWFMEEIALDAAMQTEDIMFRWSVDETNGDARVRAVEFSDAIPAFTVVSSLVTNSVEVDILEQRVDITGTDAFEYCLDGTVQMNYQIRGVFGDDAVVALEVDNGGWEAVEVNGEAVEFTGITSGNGTIALDLANVDNDLSSGIFRLVVEDETNEDYPVNIDGNQNAVAIAIVPMFDGDTEFDVNTINICEGEEVTVEINDAQENFSYQLRDYLTGALVGPEVIAEGTEVEIELGAITDNWTLEMIITAQTENGLVCGTYVPNDQLEINVRQESALYWNNDGEWTLVDGTEQLVACASTWDIAVGYYDNDGDFNDIPATFYRNNLNTQVGSANQFQLPAVEGNYFARFEDCEENMVQTASVEVIEAYPTPEITVPATASCDAEFIELTAPAGFAYYEWRRNNVVFNANNESTVTVTQGGKYEVRVSNTDACYSEWSDEVTITMEDAYRALVYVDGTWDAVVANQEVSVCDTVRLGYNYSTTNFIPNNTANDSIIVWYRNGVALQGVSGNNFQVTQPGTYQARYVSDNCDYWMEEIVVDFDNAPATPVVAVNGPTDFCEGEASLTLVAPAGFASYEWRRNGITVSNTASSANEFEVSATGSYTVRVVTANGCISQWSTAVNATVHTLPAVHAATINDQELCEAGEVTVLVPLVENDVMYQLFDVVTGQASGAARMGTTNANLVLTSDEIESTTMLEVRAYRLNAVDCEAVSKPFEVTVFEMTIAASGNTLIANVNNPVGATYQWYRNGVMITNGGNNATLDIYDDADYFVVVSTNNGCSLEDGFGKSKGATIEEEQGITVNVFPNPASNNVNVHYTSGADEDLVITVLSIEGKVVYQSSDVKTAGTYETVIPVDQFTSGTYMIHINGTENQLVNKFIKQ